jgi:type VI secretion system protein ImpH
VTATLASPAPGVATADEATGAPLPAAEEEAVARGERTVAAMPLMEALFARPDAFDFYQAVRLLESAAPEARSVGEGADPSREAVRFRTSVSLGFPASDVVRVEHEGGATVPTMTVSFLSLAGAQGPLPQPIAERVLQRVEEGDPGLRDFLDLFHHRLVSLAYRIGRRTRPVLQGAPPAETETAASLWALMGMGTPGLRGRLEGTDDRALMARAGLLARQPRSQAGLEGLLADHFGVPVSVQPLAGRWLPIPEDQQTRIGATGGSRRLGTSAVLGTRFHDPNAAVGIRMGPMDPGLYRELLPGGCGGVPAEGPALTQLRELVRFYAGVETSFVLTLVLRADQVPATVLEPGPRPRLGWTSWLRTRPAAGDGTVLIDPERPRGCGA